VTPPETRVTETLGKAPRPNPGPTESLAHACAGLVGGARVGPPSIGESIPQLLTWGGSVLPVWSGQGQDGCGLPPMPSSRGEDSSGCILTLTPRALAGAVVAAVLFAGGRGGGRGRVVPGARALRHVVHRQPVARGVPARHRLDRRRTRPGEETLSATSFLKARASQMVSRCAAGLGRQYIPEKNLRFRRCTGLICLFETRTGPTGTANLPQPLCSRRRHHLTAFVSQVSIHVVVACTPVYSDPGAT
jgi:hypothetical protein